MVFENVLAQNFRYSFNSLALEFIQEPLLTTDMIASMVRFLRIRVLNL